MFSFDFFLIVFILIFDYVFYSIRGHNIWWLITVTKEKNYMSQIQQDVWSEEVFIQTTAAYDGGYGIQDLKAELPKPEGWQ